MYLGGNMNYIGSKFSILSYIDEVVEDFTKLGKNVIFCDIFSGTGVVSKYFKEKGTISILICRFIPIVRSLISIPAGIYKTNMSLYKH